MGEGIFRAVPNCTMLAKVSLAGRSTAPSRLWPSPSHGAHTAPRSAASAVAQHGPLGRRTERAPVTGYIIPA